MGLSFSPERSRAAWEEAKASASLMSQLSFSESVSFSKTEIHRGGAFGLHKATFSPGESARTLN